MENMYLHAYLPVTFFMKRHTYTDIYIHEHICIDQHIYKTTHTYIVEYFHHRPSRLSPCHKQIIKSITIGMHNERAVHCLVPVSSLYSFLGVRGTGNASGQKWER